MQILAPEKLRGLGGILVSSSGKRFVNELDTRDVVTKAILSQNDSNIFLVMDHGIPERFGAAMNFYVSKGLVKMVEGLEGLSQAIHADKETIKQTLDDINNAADGNAVEDTFPKRPFYHKFDMEVFFYARVWPSVHYTMGGLKIDSSSRVLTSNCSQPIQGLFAAGEVTGGVHGKNRLGGNSLLECIVFGRIAGTAAAASPPIPASERG